KLEIFDRVSDARRHEWNGLERSAAVEDDLGGDSIAIHVAYTRVNVTMAVGLKVPRVNLPNFRGLIVALEHESLLRDGANLLGLLHPFVKALQIAARAVLPQGLQGRGDVGVGCHDNKWIPNVHHIDREITE